MLLSDKINSSESKYKKILEEFFNGIFDTSYLPSHGIDHHKRVWIYAKEILNQLDKSCYEIDQSLTDKLIIASYLHDSGMAIDTGLRHGIESRKICENFLETKTLSEIDFFDVLKAIENHDNKEYTITNQPENIHTVLTIADDLDAFGFIGIYRYLEIYITRKRPMEELGEMIIENCENRFQNFLRTYGFCTELIERHSKRYKTINFFFNSYNQQVPFYRFDNQLGSGYCGVAEIIKEMAMNKFQPRIHSSLRPEYHDPVIQWYFFELQNEFNYFNDFHEKNDTRTF